MPKSTCCLLLVTSQLWLTRRTLAHMPVCSVAKSVKQREKSQTTYSTECTLKIVPLLCNLWKNSKPAILELSAFFRSFFFTLDELHLVARGIRKHIYDLITVSLTKETKFSYTCLDDTLSSTEYPFFVPRTTGFIHSIGAHFHLISIRFHLIRTH
ncbi:hypothetical protein PHYBLDRAFT_72507 [Phycomyces blakesleeanus NRRL 1555(-)]|uniref:Secreted protein n=1 Tax=Phycomyces blakesleeanus (strain ATCC 8743b / DSM 1359 / FGSC 10004 / NBRC 33097 / NRRL 1555) TaxID=763407 RepID=A0A162TUB5_PHYB8|nr:hypothetical protein PHYBLDRAFT_72507 [Phycomyces blakesleeanus NRRL 1555(-)]OAD71062.1 hypothetical protein PHYBLDRAFT_72507 [Phycomyces blakesleeanus NRRL 1555(-)]|eukprot:XP_018289102.1 hypothetical protein PHYBLDRAFT_72507 [Phycomyces blakesleeanus NRRL 1555(-)]